MPPIPIDGPGMMNAVANVQPAPPGGTIPLSTLIEYIIQSTYHELTVLSELLPRKTDMERKIEIVQFASRSRQLFVRLLALVKWANSATKVDKCAMISNFLDQQAMLFVDTADILAKMSRVTLVRARLPSFSIPCAIDVLTTGTYPRLPTCIKEKIVPPDPITPQEKWQTLVRLNQIIEHRLVTTDLPKHMKRPKIQNGRVKFKVDHEFEVTLTLMGDGNNIPWRLLDIEILVEDPETGGGKALVHSFQVNYIHQLVQARLMENEKPLDDLYRVLHCFCQSLQLEVLHSQCQCLVRQRLGEHIRIEDYKLGKRLVLSYWRDPHKREAKPSAQIFKLIISEDEKDCCRPLQVTHFPQIQGAESIKVGLAIKSDHLSVEKFLIHTIQIRSLSKLKELEREFRLMVPGLCETRDLPSVLYVPVASPCSQSEMLTVSIDMQKGNYLASLASKETTLTNEIGDCLNGDRRDLRRHLTRLRLWIGLQRCLKSAQHIGVIVHESLPFTKLTGHPLEKLNRSHIFIRLAKHANHYLVVETQEVRKRQLAYNYYLLQVEPCNQPDGGNADKTAITPNPGIDSVLEELHPVYVKPGHMMQLDTYLCTHGVSAKAFDTEEEEMNSIQRKRKLLLGDSSEPPNKKTKGSVYFVSDLTHILALCEDRIPFIALADELHKRDIPHQGLEVSDDGAGLTLSIIGMPPCPDLSEEGRKSLAASLLSFKFRIQRKGSRYWLLEYVFTNCPVTSMTPKECGPSHRVYHMYDISSNDTMEKTVQSVMDDWNSVAKLYDAMTNFSTVYNIDRFLQSEIEVKSYTYKKLILGYGPNKSYTCTINYRHSESAFRLMFGTVAPTSSPNCHTVMVTQLQRELNHTKSIPRLAQILADTWSPMVSLGRLNCIATLGIAQRPMQPVPTFTILPQSPSHIRVAFRTVYCLDIHCRAGRIVSIRDGTFSKFDSSKAVEGFSPIPALKAFLNLFVDDASTSHASRRRSTVEDDNPPSPLGMELDTFMAQQNPATGSPGAGSQGSQPQQRGKQQDGVRFQSPLTPTSNPCTPASPATSRGSNQPVITPSPGNVMAPSPSNAALHVPSPSSFVPAPSPSSLGIHMPSPATQFISPQGMVDGGSPAFPRGTGDLSLPSPSTARNWPASPASVPGPSPASRHGMAHSPQTGAISVLSPPTRVLPQRSWAASVPTLLSHDALNKLTIPQGAPSNSSSNVSISPLEKFLLCNFMRRQLMKAVQQDPDHFGLATTNEPGVVLVKGEWMQLKFAIHPATLQSFTLSITPQPNITWEQEELNIVQQFFDTKVSVYPYRANVVASFLKILTTPHRVLKDLIQIMKLELVPDKSMRWSLSWCLTQPHCQFMAPYGSVMMIINGVGKMLFMLQLTRIGLTVTQQSEANNTLYVPVLYDMNSNITSSADNRGGPGKPNLPPAMQAVGNMFKRFAELNARPNEVSLYPAIRELLANLQVPS